MWLFSILTPVMSGRGHRKLRLCSRKNYERKKQNKKLSTSTSLTVSLPLTLFYDTPFTTFESLQARVKCAGIIPRGICTCVQFFCIGDALKLLDWRKEWHRESLTLFQLTSESELNVTSCVTVLKDLTYTVSFRGMPVDSERGGILANFPPFIHSGIYCMKLTCTSVVQCMFCVVSTLKLVLESVADSYICIGNADNRFVSLPTIRHGVLKDHSSKYM